MKTEIFEILSKNKSGAYAKEKNFALRFKDAYADSHKDYKIVGGSEKLFKHFINTYNIKSVISYCDASKFNGDVYKRLVFEQYKSIRPSKHWYNIKTEQHITDNLLRQRGFDQLFNTNYGKGTSNEELMLEHDFLPIYDCGQITFIYKKK